ncbi:hypothetical protein VE26_08560 [Devosia chinhatensis]|uniref:TfoX N-terminal domain-containing protein n=2 Tax=Devosia chinhatensis TaxID=429727 RepID=A0A0F5FLU0_9HYPH|nr:hypothetical protein VE26_08560 [Devosia chinhatensis]
MACDALAERIRSVLPPALLVREQKMFGGIAFMVDGNMLVCPTREGQLIVRVGKDGMAAALEQPGAATMDMAGRRMSGFVVVDGDALEDDAALEGWLTSALAFVRSLPAK